MDDVYGFSGGVIAFLILVLDIIVLMEIIRSKRDIPMKLLWALIIFMFPVVGIIIYFIFADRSTGYVEMV